MNPKCSGLRQHLAVCESAVWAGWAQLCSSSAVLALTRWGLRSEGRLPGTEHSGNQGRLGCSCSPCSVGPLTLQVASSAGSLGFFHGG